MIDIATKEVLINPSIQFIEIDHDRGFVLDGTKAIKVQETPTIEIFRLLKDHPKTLHDLAQQSTLAFPLVIQNVAMLEHAAYIIDKCKLNEDYIHIDEISPSIFNTKTDAFTISIIPFQTNIPSLEKLLEIKKTDKATLPIFLGAHIFIGPLITDDHTCLECLQKIHFPNYNIKAWAKKFKPQQIAEVIHFKKEAIEKLKSIILSIEETIQKEKTFAGCILIDQQNPQQAIDYKKYCTCAAPSSQLSHQMNNPVMLQESKSDGDYLKGYRSCTPEETWDKYQHLINPYWGPIVTFKDISPKEEKNSFVYVALHPTIPNDVKPRLEDFLQNSFGKGIHANASRASALGEAIERSSMHLRGNEPVIHCPATELSDKAIFPSEIQHFAPLQLEGRETTMGLGAVPQKMSFDDAIDWLPAWSITSQKKHFVPLDCVYHSTLKHPNHRVGVFETNGLSAGNTLEEAILQGLLELIERDATAIWWFNKLKMPEAPINVMENDPWFFETLREISDLEWEISFLDLTIDTGVPVIAAVGKHTKGYLIGYGCHPDLRLAINRALSEFIQIKTLMKPVSAPEGTSVEYLVPSSTAVNFPTIFDTPIQSQANTILKISEHLLKLNIETLVINCTRNEIGMPVAKVICPGLRPFRPRFGHGRLFDVPVKLGIIPHKNTYNDLNTMWLIL